MNALLNEWLKTHSKATNIPPKPDDPATLEVIEFFCDQAGRVPHFAAMKVTENQVYWKGASHSFKVNYKDSNGDHAAHEIELETPLVDLKIYRESDRSKDLFEMAQYDPSACMKYALSPFIEILVPDSPSEEEVIDAVTYERCKSNSPDSRKFQRYMFGAPGVGLPSHPNLPNLNPTLTARGIFQDKKCSIILSIIRHCLQMTLENEDPLTIMQRIARHKSRENNRG